MGRGSLSRAVIAVSTVGHCRSHAPPLRVHPLRNSLRSFASPSLRRRGGFLRHSHHSPHFQHRRWLAIVRKWYVVVFYWGWSNR